MAITYHIDPADRLVVITGDYATATEWLLMAGQLRRDPLLKPGFNIVRDLRGATKPPNSAMTNALFNVVHRFWQEFRMTKAAIVTDHPDASVPLALADLARSAGMPLAIFTTMEQAAEWFGGASQPT